MGDVPPPVFNADDDQLPPPGSDRPIVGPPLTSSTFEIACPDEPTDFPREHFDRYFRDVYCTLKQYHLGDLVTGILAGLIVGPVGLVLIGKDVLLAVLQVFVPPFAGAALSVIDGLRKTLDPTFAKLAVSVIGELMGADLTPDIIPGGTNFSDHVKRAEALGRVFHNLLFAEFAGKSELTPEDGVKAAERFSGLVINFGTATGIIAALGGMVPIGHLDEIREIGEEVAKNLGLGRLHRIAMMPIFHTLMAVPYQWAINLKLRPTQFSVADLMNPYTQVLMDDTTVHDAMARAGFSDDKIKKLIQLHQKRLSFGDLFDLKIQRKLNPDEYARLTKAAGIAPESLTLFEVNEENKILARFNTDLLDAAAEAFRFGNITRDELQAVAEQILASGDLVSSFMATQDYKRRVPHRSLTVAQIEHLFQVGIFDLNEFDDRLSGLGFSDDDVSAIRLDILLKLDKQAEAEKAKAKKAADAAAKAAAKSGSAPAGT